MAELKDKCERRRGHHNQEARHAVESQRYTELILKLSIFLCTASPGEQLSVSDRPRTLKLKMPVREFAAAVLERRRGNLRRYGKRIEDLDEAGLHALRIVIKKHRYAAEFFASAYPHKETKRYTQSLSEIQDVLGCMNDAANTERMLSEVSLENDGKDLHEAIGIVLGSSVRSMLCDKNHLLAAWKNFTPIQPFW
jgi:CHAD domain-containing protein